MWLLFFTALAFAQTPYEELGVPPNATEQEIKQARMSLIRKYHPDRAPPGKEKEFTERLARINAAYDKIKAEKSPRPAEAPPHPKETKTYPVALSEEEEAFERFVREYADEALIQDIKKNTGIYGAFADQMVHANTEPQQKFLRLHLNYLMGKRDKLGSAVLSGIVRNSLSNTYKARDITDFSSYGRALERAQNVFDSMDLGENLGGEYSCRSFFRRFSAFAGKP